MRLSAPRLAVSAVAIGAAAATAGVVLTASGSPAKTTPVINRAAAAPAADQPELRQLNESDSAVRAYWTPARLSAALKNGSPKAPVRTGTSAGSLAGAAAAPAGPELKVAPAPAGGVSGSGGVSAAGTTAKVWTRHGKAPALTTGKVFFKMGGLNYVCSASVVTAPNASTVWTAGHCLNDPGKAWASYVLFRPDFINGRSRGQWTARLLSVSQGWSRKGDPGYDVGAFVVRPQPGGRKLRSFTGAQGIWFNIRGFKHNVRSFGYPEKTNKGRPMNGKLLWWCSDKTWGFKFRGLAATNRAMVCTMGPGSSGGPWIYGMKSNGYGYIIGNVSHGVNNGAFVSSPYLGASAKNVWNSVKKK